MNQNRTIKNFDLVDDALLSRLRAGYDEGLMQRATRAAASQLYPGGAGYVNAVVDGLYADGPLAARDRERCLIALLARRQEPLMLSVHLYWGVAAGLSPEEVAHTLLLAGAYTGIPNYTAGLVVLEQTAAALTALAAETEGDIAPMTVLGHLRKTFNG